MSAESNPPQALSVRILSTNKDIGKVIGEHGRDISLIREQCQAVLHISELTKGIRERVLTIKGTPSQVGAAFERVCPKLIEQDKDDITLSLLVPNIMAGRIIGKGGEKIKAIKLSSNCNVNVANEPIDNSTERKVSLTGTCDSVLSALEPIVALLAENTNRIRDAQMVYYVPGAPQLPAAHLLGQPPSSFLTPLLLSGQIPQLNAAVALAAQQAQAQHLHHNQAQGHGRKAQPPAPLPPHAQEQILTIQINVPANSIGAIIGHRGANIRDIRRQSGADINVAEAAQGDERSIMIKGNLHQNELALYLIQTTLAAAPAARRAPKGQSQGQGQGQGSRSQPSASSGASSSSAGSRVPRAANLPQSDDDA